MQADGKARLASAAFEGFGVIVREPLIHALLGHGPGSKMPTGISASLAGAVGEMVRQNAVWLMRIDAAGLRLHSTKMCSSKSAGGVFCDHEVHPLFVQPIVDVGLIERGRS
jgi:hypothetical protein